MMTDYIDVKAKENCSMIVLDALQEILLRIVFLYNQGYGPKGFHFVKSLMKKGYLKLFYYILNK
jgi:hypothetical protein